jgi:putative ABC transport system permease protein
MNTSPIPESSVLENSHSVRNLVKLFKLAYRNLFRNKRRSFFAILIAVSGCTALCVAAGYYSFSIYSLQELTIRNGFGGSSGSGHVQIIDKRVLEGEEQHTLQFGLDSTDALIAAIKKDVEVDYVLPRVEFGGLISNGDRSVPFKGYGVEVEKEMKLWGGMSEINPRLKLGEQLMPLTNGHRGIILGKILAGSLHAKVGDILMVYSNTVDGALNGTDAKLLGIMSTGVSETDKYYLLTNLNFVQELMNSRKISLLSVMFKKRKDLDRKIQELNVLLQAQPDHGNQISLLPWYTQAGFYRSIRDIFDIIFSFMGTIILVIVLLSCWNIMNMTTMERIREIGTLRAIGLNVRNINTIFVMESFLIGLIGVAIGMLLQWGISAIINSLRISMPPVPGMSRPYTLQVYASTIFHPFVVVGMLLAITVSSFSSLAIIKNYSIVESLDHN